MAWAALIVAIAAAVLAFAGRRLCAPRRHARKELERAEERRQLQELLRIAERVIHLATEISDNAHERQELAREARGLLAGASLSLPATEDLATRTYGDRREVWTAAATASRDELLARLRAAGSRPATSDPR